MIASLYIFSRTISTYYPVLFIGLGCVSIILFNSDIFIEIWVSVFVFVWVSLFMIQQYRQKRLGILMLLIWLVFALPFIHIVPYLWFDFASEDPLILWGYPVNPYMLNENIIKLTAMIGAVGGLGFSLGVSLNSKKIIRETDNKCVLNSNKSPIESLSIPIWSIWVLVGIILSWIAAPQETLFTSVYTSSLSILDQANVSFSSAWLVSYVLFAYALCDAIIDSNSARRLFKQQMVFWAIAFVVVFFQLLRGDREIIPFVFGTLLVYFYWAAPLTQQRSINLPWIKIAIGGFLLVFVSMILGNIRDSLVNVSSFGEILIILEQLREAERIGASNLLHGTWSAVLLTPLSVAGDHVNGLLSLKLGQSYLDLFLSIPPGFVADAIGYIRPLNATTGPAWEMRYGIGGKHASVVPFMNFRMLGVFLVPALLAYLISSYEKRALKKLSVINLSLLNSIVMVSPHWLWYGQKAGVNMFIIWFLLAALYRISLLLSNQASSFSFLVPLKTNVRK